MTDCHSHLLPGVDDGVKTLSETLEILKEMEKQGIAEVWFTPHIMEDIPNKTADLRQMFEETEAVYQAVNGTIKLHLAAEYMLDNLFVQRLETGDLLPLHGEKRYLLVETSYFNPPMELLPMLECIRVRGYHPLLAHPERYEYMQMADYKALQQAGVLFQLNIPSLAGMYGKHVQKKAEALQEAGMYSLRGNDIHSLGFFQNLLNERIRK
ncbi:tyrosine-protein phosphatase [Phocaeicola faecalis]